MPTFESEVAHSLAPSLQPHVVMEFEAPYALLFPWVTQALGVIVFFLIHRFEVPIPYVGIMFCLGLAMGVGALRIGADDQLTQSILQWSFIDSRLILLVFLPGLIFRDAIAVNFDLFMVAFAQILTFALPMVLAGTFLTALFVMNVLPYGWSWSLSLTLGSILSSTDPIAMTSVLKKAEASPRLKLHLNGESLLNDASAVVLYTIFSLQFLSELDIDGLGTTIGWPEGIEIFFRMSLGGVAVGILFAIGLILMMYELDRRLDQENNVVQVALAVTVAYLAYYTAEMQFSMSGIVACVTCGILSSAYGKGLINDQSMMDSYLSLLEHLLNTLLFTLGGVVFGEIIANTDFRAHFEWSDWGYMFALYLAVTAIRYVQVGLVYPLISCIGLKSNVQEMSFFAYGGLRGAVGIALALSLDGSVREATLDEERRALTTKLVGLSGGVTLLTLLINGTTAGFFLRKLGLSKPTKTRKRVLQNFESSTLKFLLSEEQKLLAEPRFSNVKRAAIRAHVPFIAKASRTNIDKAARRFQQEAKSHPDEENIVSIFEMETTPHIDCLLRLSAHADNCPAELLQEIRQIFLELLEAAYRLQMATGQLNDHEDHGFNVGILLDSVAFAVEDCNHKDAIQDWQYTMMYRFRNDAEAFFSRRSLSTHINDKRACANIYQQLRINTVRAIAFIEAHRLAENKLVSYLENSSIVSDSIGTELHDLLRGAIQAILGESQVQVEKAEQLLKDIDPRDLNCITSHYVSIILLHRLSLRIEASAADGTLKEKEAQLYLNRVKRNIAHAHLCPSCHADSSSSAADGSVSMSTTLPAK
mmetsp:Transcript_12076/g.34529  ORF Transcript_12076/g.34529 Transcript_12076/m.34529 type:complete len:815 (+) Transcript_12076:107-2551(+)